MALAVIRWAISLFIALAAGLFGLSLFFSDLGPNETMTERLLMAVILYTLAGLIIGLINPSFWPVAGLTAWGSSVLGLAAMISVFLGTSTRTIEHWFGAVGLFLGPLGIALAAGWVGARLRRSPR